MTEKNKSQVHFMDGLPTIGGGYFGCNPRTEVDKTYGIICEYDHAVSMRDGVNIYVNIFRPGKDGEYPVLIAWSPYGKHGRVKYAMFPNCGQSDADLSRYVIFESGDPAYWCANGYIIISADARGSWGSEGDLTFHSEQEAQDCCDLIKWAADQPWSNGRVGMLGVSYLAWIQWSVAALNPPHLAAISPWEGVSDFYRELYFHGGIPETVFTRGLLKVFWAYSKTRVEDVEAMAREHPLFDEYWAGKNADLSKITVPAFIVASWCDHSLHTRGTLEAFKKIASEDKWLLVHGRKKWEFFYRHKEKQRKFFDKFLKDINNEVGSWPRVMLEVRERFYEGNFRHENQWPLERTEYTKLFLNARDGEMGKSPFNAEGRVSYNVDNPNDKTRNTVFEYEFDERTELTGHMKLRLWVQADGNDDMDLFVAIEKMDRDGEFVPFPFCTNHEDGPVALGWLRISHRELDEEASTPYQPVYKHRKELKLEAGQIVPVDIEIWPASTLFEKGEKLRVVIQGSDIHGYTEEQWVANQHTNLVNQGEHVIHTGDKYDSHLLVPVIPE